MRRAFKIVIRLVLLAVLAAAVLGFWKREELQRLWAVNSLFEEGKIVANFSNMRGAFLSKDVPRGDGPVTPLPAGTPFELPADVNTWINDRTVTSLVILKDGALVHESYHQGTNEGDLRISWSVAKSYLSALVGTLIADGSIASLDDPATKYAPALAGGAYDGATVRDVLNMASGVVFDEDYLDYDSDINKMGRVLALGGSMDAFAAGLTETFAAPGTDWTYVSIDTHVISMIIRGAVPGKDIATLLSERVVVPMGLEAAPYYLTDGLGTAFVLGGLNLTTRDYARMGLMVAQDGQLGGKQIIPADWVRASTEPSAPTSDGEWGYGYQWWSGRDAQPGEFFARGIYGQYVYINQPAGVVIATTAADRAFREAGVSDENVAIFRDIAAQLK